MNLLIGRQVLPVMLKYFYLVVFSSVLGFAVAHSTLGPKRAASQEPRGIEQEHPVDNRFIAFPLFSAQHPDKAEKASDQQPETAQEEPAADDSMAWRLEEASMYFLYRLLRGFVHLYR
jgi:hypothetical protein